MLKPKCCPNMPARKIARSVHEAARVKVRAIAKTEAYALSCRERKKVEMPFAHLKRILRLGRLRLRGPNGAKDEFLLAATAQNLRKLEKPHSAPGAGLRPGGEEAPLASLAAAAHAHRARLKTGFFNKIDVKRSFHIGTLDVAIGVSGRSQLSPYWNCLSGPLLELLPAPRAALRRRARHLPLQPILHALVFADGNVEAHPR